MAEFVDDDIVKAIKLAEKLGLRLDGYYTVEYRRILSTDEACERYDWLRDAGRLGFFDYRVMFRGSMIPVDQNRDSTIYYFTNEKTAFEFKMRWR